jgi:hypothetical protein
MSKCLAWMAMDWRDKREPSKRHKLELWNTETREEAKVACTESKQRETPFPYNQLWSTFTSKVGQDGSVHTATRYELNDPGINVPFNVFFTPARTCYCPEQKIFTRPDDCAALQKFSCNMHSKNTYNEILKIPAARQQFSARGSISLIARPRTRAAWSEHCRGSNPGGGKVSRTCPDRPWGPPSILYSGPRVPFAGVKRPRRGIDHPPHLALRLKKEYSYTSTPFLDLYVLWYGEI